MHMVCHAADSERLAIGIAGDRGEIRVELGPDGGFDQRLAILGAENDVENDEAQRLWHDDGAGLWPCTVAGRLQ